MAESDATLRTWIHEPLAIDVSAQLRRLGRSEGVEHIAVMPDVHLAEGVCIGTVLACDGRVFPQAVGMDIGCGMAAVRLDGTADLLDKDSVATTLLRGLERLVPAHRHAGAREPGWVPDRVLGGELSHGKLTRLISREGTVQFGTLGRGNHFLEIQADGEDRLWLMVHSGSRAMGHAIATRHLDRASRTPTGFACFEASTPEGQAYLADANWAVEYARENRARMLESAATLFDALCGVSRVDGTAFDSVHNFVREEEHGGRHLFVHRKGANSAAADETSIIPGSMGTSSFHVTGRGCDEALRSCSHGAGRALSRTEARRRITRTALLRDMGEVRFDLRRARNLVEEAPAAYKDITAVMRAQKPLVRRLRELRPLLNHRG